MSTIVTDAVTALSGNLALLPEGSGVVTIDGLTHPAADGSAGQLMKTNGSGVLSFTDAPSSGYTLTAEQATASGSGITFGSIPSGVQQVVMMVEGTSCGSDGDIYIQLGDGGGLETSGYNATGGYVLQVSTTGVTRSSSSFIWRHEGDPAYTFHFQNLHNASL